ncbi:MAG: hypothetical protein JWP22_3897, partial [Ramlibacter sp.]|nr:hypothetical protein [Ramlibacter sp.]
WEESTSGEGAASALTRLRTLEKAEAASGHNTRADGEGPAAGDSP